MKWIIAALKEFWEHPFHHWSEWTECKANDHRWHPGQGYYVTYERRDCFACNAEQHREVWS